MKFNVYIFLTIICCYDLKLAAQNYYLIAIAPTKMNVFYIGMDNPVDIVICNTNPNLVSATIDNGKIVRIDGENGKYIVRPKHAGKAVVTVYARNREVSKKEFRVKLFPLPVAKVAGRKDGKITIKSLISNKTISAYWENLDIDGGFYIDSFTMKIYQEHNLIFKEKTTGNGFTNTMIEQIYRLMPRQKIVIDNITLNNYFGTEQKLNAINFEVY